MGIKEMFKKVEKTSSDVKVVESDKTKTDKVSMAVKTSEVVDPLIEVKNVILSKANMDFDLLLKVIELEQRVIALENVRN